MLPSWKQKELLDYIEAFIKQNGYSPSYREIMSGLEYTSVATVALHINSLIKRGHLRKRDKSARSLEVIRQTLPKTEDKLLEYLMWLNNLIDNKLSKIEGDEALVAVATVNQALQYLELEELISDLNRGNTGQ